MAYRTARFPACLYLPLVVILCLWYSARLAYGQTPTPLPTPACASGTQNAIHFTTFNFGNNISTPTSTGIFSSYSFSAWVTFPGPGVNGELTRWKDAAAGYNFTVFVNSGNYVGFKARDSSDHDISIPVPSFGGWHHIVATAESNDSAHLYVDGQEVGTPQAVGTLWNDGTTLSAPSTASLWGGYVDDVRFWTSALSATDAATLYNNGQGSCEPVDAANLYLWWKMDDTSGSTATDSSGNGHNGMVNPGASFEWTTNGFVCCKNPTEATTPTPTPTLPPCEGACTVPGVVTADDMIKLVNISLELAPPETCSGGGPIDTETLIVALNHLLLGCPRE